MHGWLTRILERHGRWYLPLVFAVAVGEACFLMVPVSVAVTQRYEGLPAAQTVTQAVTASLLLMMCMLVGVVSCLPWTKALHRWCRGERTSTLAREAAVAVHRMPLRFLAVSLTLGLLIPDPIGIQATMSYIHKHDLGTFALLFVGGTFFALWGIVVLWVWVELAMRPIIASVARVEPDAFEKPSLRVTVTMQLLIAISSATLVGAVYTGALTAPSGSALRGLRYLLEVTAGVSLLTGLLFGGLFGTLILTPVRQLTIATRQVAGGNLDSKIPLATNDELGDMAASFNSMVDGLRERSRLRQENSSLIVELRASRERLVMAGDAARRRVEQDLHDGAQQMLVLLRLKLGLLAKKVATDEALSASVAELRDDLDRALQDLRDLAHGIYPAVLDASGIPGALAEAATRVAIPATVQVDLPSRYRPELEFAVYFCCLEAMQNASKHAGDGASVRVELRELDGALVFEVADNGTGFETINGFKHNGLQNLADRLGAVGGTVRVESAPGAGTRVAGILPLEQGDRIVTVS